ncbi:MAG: hypothetical protein WD294_13975 [Phycisphaeraceae bacterium]
MPDRPDYILDIPSLASDAAEQGASAGSQADDHTLKGRPWLSIYWRCCHVYSRIYRNREQTAYAGYCPGCRRHVKATIGENGTNCRLFYAE